MAFLKLSDVSRFRPIIVVFLLCLMFVAFMPVFSATSSDRLTTPEVIKKTDLFNPQMKLYSLALELETGVNLRYNMEAFFNFSEKFSRLLDRDTSELGKTIKKKCNGCSPIIMPTFNDDPDFIRYITTGNHSMTESGETDIAVIVMRHLNPVIKEELKVLGINTITSDKNLRGKIIEQSESLRKQVQDLTDGLRDTGWHGEFTDESLANSPYDLMDDRRRIDEIFFREAPEFGKYLNTNAEDAPALITGHVSGGSWWGGETYRIDLASDIEKALGGWDSPDWSTWGDGVLAGDCDSGYCITIDFIKNTHYFLGQWGASDKWKNSFQWLFEEGLEWIIKNGDNRNFACKVTPPINFLESEFDAGAILKNLFSGDWISIFWRTPPFLQWQKEINWSASKEEKLKKQDKETTDSLKDSFKRRGLDIESPTKLKDSPDQLFEFLSFYISFWYIRAGEWLEADRQRINDREQYLLASWSGTGGRSALHNTSTKSIEYMEKMFDALWSNTKKLHDLMKDLNIEIKALAEKRECGDWMEINGRANV